MNTHHLVSISRPRFWLYTFGPFLVGIVAGYSAGVNWPALLTLALYFTFPANLLIYGINDIYDYDTDKQNPKKKGYEHVLAKSQQQKLNKLIIVVGVAPLALLISFGNLPIQSYIFLAGFWFFGTFYSAPPLRAKTKPFLDGFFNILYVMPALAGYGLTTSRFPELQIVVAATFWCMATHAYSAVPDIEADEKARLSTIATFLGRQNTIIYSLLCYGLAAILSYDHLGLFSVVAGTLYVTYTIASLRVNDKQFFKMYELLPFVNLLVGIGLFFTVYMAL